MTGQLPARPAGCRATSRWPWTQPVSQPRHDTRPGQDYGHGDYRISLSAVELFPYPGFTSSHLGRPGLGVHSGPIHCG